MLINKKIKWKRALVVVSLNKLKNASEKSIRNVMSDLNSKKVRVIKYLGHGLFIIKKRDCSYESIGKRIEGLFKNHKIKKHKIVNNLKFIMMLSKFDSFKTAACGVCVLCLTGIKILSGL